VILDGSTSVPKILLTSWVVKGEIASPNFPHFPAKIAAFGLKYGILKKNAKNSISGRRRYEKSHKSESFLAGNFQGVTDDCEAAGEHGEDGD